jgi:hypothetical protein
MPNFVNFNRKAWVASIAAPIVMFFMSFVTAGLGLEIPGLETSVTMAVTWGLTWLVPNES